MPRRESTMDIGKMGGDMEKGFLLTLMETSTLAGGSLEKKKEMALTSSNQQT